MEGSFSTPVGLFTYDELAEYLKVSRGHVFHLIKRGHLPRPIKLGVLVRFSRVEIDAWIAAGAPRHTDWECIKAAQNGLLAKAKATLAGSTVGGGAT